MKKKFFLFFMVFVMLLVPMPIGASQATRNAMNEAQRRRDAARAQVQGTQNLLQGLRSEMDAIMLQMQAYDERLVDAEDALEDIELALLGTELRIEYAEIDLDAAREDFDLQNEVLRARLRAMHESGPVGLLEVLFQAASFSDFLMRMEYVRVVAQFDQEVLDRLETAEARVVGNIETLNRERNLITDLRFQQELAIRDLENAIEERATWLYALAENEEALAIVLEMQAEEERILDEAFGVIQVQFRAEEADAARRAREEAARRAEEQRLAATAHLNNFQGQFAWPIPTHSRISSPFGSRSHPITRRQENHSGVDVPAPSGTRINAAADGVVTLSGRHGGYGITVIIYHGNGYSTLYAHNSRNLVSEGQNVERGQHIANVGTTGVSTGNHLHFEIRRNGRAVNPMSYFGQ